MMQTETIFTSLTPDQLVLKIVSALKVQMEDMLPRHIVPPQEPDDLMTALQTSDWLQLSLPSLRKFTKQKILPCIRIGCNVRYKKSDILRALAKGDLKQSRRRVYNDSS